MIESISPEQIAAIIAALVALINAIVAVLKNNEAKANAKEKEDVTRFYDQDNVDPVPPDVIEQLPPHTYTMSDATRSFVLSGLSPEDRIDVTAQIAAAEASRRTVYYVTHAKGWYRIEYGALTGGGDGRVPE